MDHLCLYLQFLMLLHLDIDEVLSATHQLMCLSFGDFNVHFKGWLTYSDGIDRPGELL